MFFLTHQTNVTSLTWRTVKVGIANEVWQAFANHSPVWQCVYDTTYGIQTTRLDYVAWIITMSIETSKFAGALSICPANSRVSFRF